MSRPAVVTALGMLGAVGCSESPLGHVAFQVTSRPSAEAASSSPGSRLAAGDSAVVALRRDTIVIRRAELVLRQLWLQPAASGECEPEEAEYCAELENDPVVVAFPLADTAEYRFTGAAKPGAYSGMQFDIYSPAPGREDEFLSSHPELAGRSVQLHGVLSKRGDRRDFVRRCVRCPRGCAAGCRLKT